MFSQISNPFLTCDYNLFSHRSLKLNCPKFSIMRKVNFIMFLVLVIGIGALNTNQLFAQNLITQMTWVEGIKNTDGFSAQASPAEGNWLELDGMNDYAEAPDSDSLDVGDESSESLTVEAWIYPRSLPPPPFPYFQDAKMIVVSKQEAYWLALFSFNDPTFGTFYGFQFGIYTSPTSSHSWGVAFLGIGLEQWYHIAGVFNNSEDTIDLYVNGVRYSWDDFTYNANESNLSLITGGPPPSSDDEYFDGQIDEIRISDIVRYSSDFTPPSDPFIPDENTRALWHFDEAIGSTSFFDSSGNNNTMTGVNGAHTDGDTGSINGHVIDALTGKPLRALIIAINAETKEKYKSISDPDNGGYYEIPDLEPGLYWILCIKRGYKLGIRKVEVKPGEPTTVDFPLMPK